MEINILLITHNLISLISAIAMLGVGIFTLLQNPRHRANAMFTLAALAVVIFIVSHLIGVNIENPEISRIVLMFNLSLFFVGIFSFHTVLVFTGKEKERKTILSLVYIAGISLTLFFIFFPDTFLLSSKPKMYFPNYYEPGTLNWIRVAWLYGIMVPLLLYEIFSSFFKSKNLLERNQYKYFGFALAVAFALGFLPNFLVYDIQFNPLWGMAFAIPFVAIFLYGALVYKIFSVQVIAKQALIYSVSVAAIGGIIALLNYSDYWIQIIYPDSPRWIIPLISSIVIVTVSAFVWQTLRNNEIIKYEFINVVTHKFHTPLTHIKWSTENLRNAKNEKEKEEAIKTIETANGRLVELTDIILKITREEEGDYEHKTEKTTLIKIIEPILGDLEKSASEKGLRVEKNFNSSKEIFADPKRMGSAFQILIENAITYSPNNGTIKLETFDKGGKSMFSVTDYGIGIEKEDLPRIFTKFYRTRKSINSNVEGFGLGLYIAKKIIEGNGGSVKAESLGENAGTIFTVTLKNT